MQSDCSNYSGSVVEEFSDLITCDQALFFFLKVEGKTESEE